MPDGVAGLCGIVGGYRLMEGRTVAATGNGCADRRGVAVAMGGCVRLLRPLDLCRQVRTVAAL